MTSDLTTAGPYFKALWFIVQQSIGMLLQRANPDGVYMPQTTLLAMTTRGPIESFGVFYAEQVYEEWKHAPETPLSPELCVRGVAAAVLGMPPCAEYPLFSLSSTPQVQCPPLHAYVPSLYLCTRIV